MALRTRRIAIDQDNTWLYRYQFVNEGDPIPPEQDYVVLSAGGTGDDASFSGLTIPVYYGPNQAYTGMTVWGSGLISFGPPTSEQISFMSNLSSQVDFSQFPGDYIATSILTNVGTIEVGMKGDFVVVTYNEGAAQIRIYPDRININGATDHGGLHIGNNSVAILGNGSFDVDLRRFMTISGDGTDNVITGNAAPETIYGYGGDDTISAGAGAHIIYGGNGNDTINGGQFRDTIYGGSGNDTIRAGASDFVDGGIGLDTLTFDLQRYAGPLFLSLPTLRTGSFKGITYVDIELFGVIGTDNNDVITGTGRADRLNGGGGFDVLIGGAGNDVLDGGIGGTPLRPYLIIGGQSFATALPIDYQFGFASGSAADDPLIPHVDLKRASDNSFNSVTDDFFTFTAAEGAVLTVDIDNLNGLGTGIIRVFNSAGTELFSDSGGDFVAGDGDGDPRLQVTLSAGTYVVEINTGNDFFASGVFDVSISLSSATVLTGNRLQGGNGDDSYVVRNINDEVIEAVDGGIDTISSFVTYTLPFNVENLTLAGTAAIDGTGNGLANIITGSNGDNTVIAYGGDDIVVGGNGNDTISGGLDNDTLYGGLGSDNLNGNAGVDTLDGGEGADILTGSFGNDTLFGGAANDTLSGNDEDDILFGDAGNDILSGGAGNDSLDGGLNNDTMDGGSGIDILIGGVGKDTMTGAGGADTFRFDDGEFGGATTATADVITDFVRGHGDKIDLALVDGITGGADDAFTFIGTAAFTGAAGQLRYEVIGGNTYVMGTTNADTTADFMIRVNGSIALIQADFVL